MCVCVCVCVCVCTDRRADVKSMATACLHVTRLGCIHDIYQLQSHITYNIAQYLQVIYQCPEYIVSIVQWLERSPRKLGNVITLDRIPLELLTFIYLNHSSHVFNQIIE